MRLIKKRKKNNINIFIIILVLLVISIIYIFKIFNEKALPLFIDYSEVEVKKIITSIISSSVNNELANNINQEELLNTTYDKEGNIISIDFNPITVNKLLVYASNSTLENLKYLESGQIDKLNIPNIDYDISNLKYGVIYELPSGILFDNPILSNIFPKIPIKIDLIGNIFCKLNTDIKSYGINNALITINIEIQVDVKILLPFTTSNTQMIVEIPVIMKIIEGNIPSYYLSGYLDSPMITNSVD